MDLFASEVNFCGKRLLNQPSYFLCLPPFEKQAIIFIALKIL